MRQKLFTYAYFLIRNNDNYMHSFLKRATAASLNLTIAGLFVWTLVPIRLPAVPTDLQNWSNTRFDNQTNKHTSQPDLKSAGTASRMAKSFCLNADDECLQMSRSTSCSLECSAFRCSITLSTLCISFQLRSILFLRSPSRSLMNSACWLDRFSRSTSSYSTSSSSSYSSSHPYSSLSGKNAWLGIKCGDISLTSRLWRSNASSLRW